MSKGTLNQVTLIGRLGADPETRVSTQGITVGQLRLATTRSVKDRQGQYQDKTDWHRVIVYSKRAEFLRDYAKKGHRLLVCGRIQTRKWQDRDGVDQFSTEVIAEDVQILETRASTQQTAQQSTYSQAAPQPSEGGDFDDDIPF